MGNRCRFFLGASLPVLAMIHKDACLVLLSQAILRLNENFEKQEKKKIFLLHEKIKVTALIFVIPCGNVYLYNLSLAGNDCRDLCRP